ncbi:MAG: tetratricopeptide repeat protein [Novosphingobium sp.]|nr:tetratricopeptide repeat protein [Novosphingobium sp.]
MNRPKPRLAISVALALGLALAAAPALAAHGPARTQAQSSTRDLYLTLIRQARTDGHVRAALAFLDDFDRQYPGDADAAILRINCLLDLDQLDAAEQAVTRLPQRKADGPTHAVRGHVLAAVGDWDGAIAEYSAALQTIPSDGQTNNALGYAQLRAGHGDAAIETLRRARELAPADPVIRNNLLLALAVSGRKEEADTLLARSGTPAFAADLRKQVSDEAARLAKVDAAHQEGRP